MEVVEKEELIKQKELLENELKLLKNSNIYKKYLEYEYLKSYYLNHYKYNFKDFGLNFKEWLRIRHAYKLILKIEKNLYPIQEQIREIEYKLVRQKRD